MKENPYSRAIENRRKAENLEPQEPLPQPLPEKPKRGRPPTGKRSDADWIGRTFYIRRETDLDVEEALLKLKRQEQEMDKSELVDFLLGEWVKSQKSKNS